MKYIFNQKRVQRVLASFTHRLSYAIEESRESLKDYKIDPQLYRQLKKELLRSASRGGR